MSDSNPAPGFLRQPDRKMIYSAAGARVRVMFNGVTVADSPNAIALAEADYPIVHYIPKADTRMEYARRTERSTHCPFKGDASYWDLEVGGKTAENALWAYETPFDEAAIIGDHVAFYASRVDSIEIG